MTPGQVVTVLKVVPQTYETDQRNEFALYEERYVGAFVGRVGRVVKVDHEQPHPVLVRFKRCPGWCYGASGEPCGHGHTMRFSPAELTAA